MKTTIRFKCPYKDCGEWIISTIGNVCSLQGFSCTFCKRKIHPSMIFEGRFGSGSLDYEKEFLAYIGSHVVELDDMAQENTTLVKSGKMSVVNVLKLQQKGNSRHLSWRIFYGLGSSSVFYSSFDIRSIT